MIKEYFKYNCSTLFILKPVVGIDMEVLSSFKLINSYLSDVNRDDITGDYLFVLFKPIDFDYFELFLEQQCSKNSSYFEDYDYADGYVVIVYKIPEILKEDFEKFKSGKYSKMSDLIRQAYEKDVRINLKKYPTFQWQVFLKSSELKHQLEDFLGVGIDDGAELWMIPDVKGKETFDINKLINNGIQPVTESNIKA